MQHFYNLSNDIRIKRKSFLWILGPGGFGKSSLAFKIAKLAEEELIKHRILPILIEEDWDCSILDHISYLTKIEERRLNIEMVSRLTSIGRILLIFDGLSERKIENAKKLIYEIEYKGILNNVIITSRNQAPQKFKEISVISLNEEHFHQFAKEYSSEENFINIINMLKRYSKKGPYAHF